MKGLTLLLLVWSYFVLGQNSISLIQTPVRTEQIEVRFNYSMAKIPMFINNGMVFVKANLNDQQRIFMLDSGAPMLIINQKNIEENTMQAASVAGAFHVGSVIAEHFSWAGIEYRKIEAVSVDLSHLESSTHLDIAGLIGYDILKNYEVFLDYEQQQLALLNPGKGKLLQATSPKETIDFTLDQHLPVLEVSIGGQTLRFAMDTGAGANLIDQKYQQLLAEGSFIAGEQETLRGVDQVVRPVTAAIVHDTQMGNLHLADMKYLFTDLSHLKTTTGLKIDGLLGYPFFQMTKCSVNYPKQRLYIWE